MRRVRRGRGWGRGHRRRTAGLLGLVVATVLLAGCSGGSYPFDVFPEMHNQPSQRRLEPERRSVPAGAVPISGARPVLTFEQAAAQANPLPGSPETLVRGSEVYRVNCAACHGGAGRGDGPVAAYYVNSPLAPVPPTDLASARVQGRTDGQLHWLLANGIGNMPAFGHVVSDADLWALVTYVRTVR
jgi:mono/diheme cytochrome c family protein